MNAEEERLDESSKRLKNWKRWGPYLSERQWATVREDYSLDGSCWTYFPHEHSRSRAYRWGEDGLLGITDRECRLCFALALWNGKDPILKERLFGLIPTEGNHGEDVKECYFYLDSNPTHSYMKALYKYPQQEFPYAWLVEENRRRGLLKEEFEITDTKIFHDSQYFDVFAEYAKNSPNDILIRITLANRANQSAFLSFLPTLWFRNTWAWGPSYAGHTPKPIIKLGEKSQAVIDHPTLGKFVFAFQDHPQPSPLFTDNDTNLSKLYGVENVSKYVKDAFHEYVIQGKKEAVNPERVGTKFSPLYSFEFAPNETKVLHFRLFSQDEAPSILFGNDFDSIFELRKKETDEFYAAKLPGHLTEEEKMISRQAYAGLLWSKQFYHYVTKEWLDGDSEQPTPPPQRNYGRNHDWKHLFCRDIISMPDKWEYPWFAAWDLGFHMIPFSKVDPEFAKMQLILFLREWYMHPNGQQPAYEFEFSDVNPPVHAWAAWRVYKITGKRGQRDRLFLESAFQKLALNFTWWVNRKDKEGNNLFSGGFLGLDNIGVFDRSKIYLRGGYLEQADATAWMAFYCLTMLSIALELAPEDPVYEDMASKFFTHFVYIADAINEFGEKGLWDEQDGFYYDLYKFKGQHIPLRTRSLVGLIPLLAVEVLEEEKICKLMGFANRMDWFLKHRKDLEDVITFCHFKPEKGRRLLAIPSKERLCRILRYLLDENEFLSPYGIRSLSKYHEKNPYALTIESTTHVVEYVPGESNSYLFGGNSNWRGPIWFPLNFLIIEALQKYDHYYGETLKVECPTGSGKYMTLKEIASELCKRLCNIFTKDESGKRPCFGSHEIYRRDPNWRNLILFNEYYHAETGAGLGASHQTGWTALVTKLFEDNR